VELATLFLEARPSIRDAIVGASVTVPLGYLVAKSVLHQNKRHDYVIAELAELKKWRAKLKTQVVIADGRKKQEPLRDGELVGAYFDQFMVDWWEIIETLPPPTIRKISQNVTRSDFTLLEREQLLHDIWIQVEQAYEAKRAASPLSEIIPTIIKKNGYVQGEIDKLQIVKPWWTEVPR
jgi:hypothetical protein